LHSTSSIGDAQHVAPNPARPIKSSFKLRRECLGKDSRKWAEGHREAIAIEGPDNVKACFFLPDRGASKRNMEKTLLTWTEGAGAPSTWDGVRDLDKRGMQDTNKHGGNTEEWSSFNEQMGEETCWGGRGDNWQRNGTIRRNREKIVRNAWLGPVMSSKFC